MGEVVVFFFLGLGLGKNVKLFRVNKFFYIVEEWRPTVAELTIAFENGGARGCAPRGGCRAGGRRREEILTYILMVLNV